MSTNLSTLPAGVIVVLVVLSLVQVTLDVISLVDLYRRPAARVAMGNKWIWVAIILLVNTIGAILYLVVGRKPAVASDVPAASPLMRTDSIAEGLYGPRAGRTDHPGGTQGAGDAAGGTDASAAASRPADGPADGGTR